jgi:hypothetical protein
MPPGLLGAGATEGFDGAEKELERLELELYDELDRLPPPLLPPPERPILPASATVASIALTITTAEKTLDTFMLNP